MRPHDSLGFRPKGSARSRFVTPARMRIIGMDSCEPRARSSTSADLRAAGTSASMPPRRWAMRRIKGTSANTHATASRFLGTAHTSLHNSWLRNQRVRRFLLSQSRSSCRFRRLNPRCSCVLMLLPLCVSLRSVAVARTRLSTACFQRLASSGARCASR